MLSVVGGNNGSLEVILSTGGNFFTFGSNFTFGGNLNDGNWHTVTMTIREAIEIIVKIDDKEEEFKEYSDKISLAYFVHNAKVVVGSGAYGGYGGHSDFFRGCMQEVRIGGVLLPFFTEDELVNSTAGQKFELQQRSDDVLMGECILCYEAECQNGGYCSDPSDEFQCNCPAGFAGPVCEENINECLASECVNGKCRDGVNSYTCDCKPGWTGTLCNKDLN